VHFALDGEFDDFFDNTHNHSIGVLVVIVYALFFGSCDDSEKAVALLPIFACLFW
jgi:hypothetical protein